MTIEIHSPNLQVNERTIDAIKKKVLNLSHLGEKISRAEIFLTEDAPLVKEDKICKIRLSIFGDDLFVSKNADSFGKAAMAAIRALKKGLKKKQELRNQPPEEVTSTVDI
ncbi:MAG TPA: HPF/RaiA family ribosome-associated protein [Chitinophagaceae bacterium]|jgi:putative sigma-54 modulation protein|nr:HPF/RaiA family ribosome-associated protein [Chitinophagaceae bacterium]